MDFESFINNINEEAKRVSANNANKAPLEDRFYKKSNKEDLRGRKQDRLERKKYADRIFALVCIWLLTVVLILIATGKDNLHYSDGVLIALLTTSSANVIGLFILVTRYLFNTK